MEKLNALRQDLQDSLATLEEVLEAIEEYARMGDVRLDLMMRDSVIQRFEYTFDTFWKYLKLILETIPIRPASPRNVFRFAKNQNIISDEDLQTCIKMIEARNETSHRYDGVAADSIATDVPAFYSVISQTSQKIFDMHNSK